MTQCLSCFFVVVTGTHQYQQNAFRHNLGTWRDCTVKNIPQNHIELLRRCSSNEYLDARKTLSQQENNIHIVPKTTPSRLHQPSSTIPVRPCSQCSRLALPTVYMVCTVACSACRLADKTGNMSPGQAVDPDRSSCSLVGAPETVIFPILSRRRTIGREHHLHQAWTSHSKHRLRSSPSVLSAF
jgi:hypothetical protein